MANLEESPAWQALREHQQEIGDLHMRDLFASDPQRFEKFSLHLGDILFDYSKNRITEQTMSLLVELAQQAGLAEQHRGHVQRREDQHHREAGGAARGAAQPRQYARSTWTGRM